MTIPKDNQFNNLDRAIIHSTTDSSLDGTEVIISGIAVDFSPLYRIYIISRVDGGV